MWSDSCCLGHLPTSPKTAVYGGGQQFLPVRCLYRTHFGNNRLAQLIPLYRLTLHVFMNVVSVGEGCCQMHKLKSNQVNLPQGYFPSSCWLQVLHSSGSVGAVLKFGMNYNNLVSVYLCTDST